MREASSFCGTAMATIFTQIEKTYSCYVPPKVSSVRALLSVGRVHALSDRGKLQTFSGSRPDGPDEPSHMEDHCNAFTIP